MIFERSYNDAIVPDYFRRSIVTPVHKKGCKSAVINYRPVSQGTIACNIFEKILVAHILNFLRKNDLLDSRQHGFMPFKSTCTQLLEMTQDWAMYINEKKSFHCIYFDQKSAFDRVSHHILLDKMSSLGIHEQTINLVSNYLNKRSFQVKVDNVLSQPYPAPSGVPQGSCASPLLYSIFVLDINKYIPASVKYLEYADDLKIYCDLNSESSHVDLQLAVDGVYRWCKENDMLLSSNKCMVLKQGTSEIDYYIGNTVLPSVNVTRDLGVLISPSLDFSEHIKQVVKSCTVMVNMIFRCFIVRVPEVYIRLYKSLILSKVLYCSSVWYPHLKKHLTLLEKIQAGFIRRLRWRCSLGRDDIILPSIEELLLENDYRAVVLLRRANLLSHFFDVIPNSLRSRHTIKPKATARSALVNNVFAWRMTKRFHDSGLPSNFL